MHLLNVDTLRLETFHDNQVLRYAILSHTWAEEEVTFRDIQEPRSLRTTSLAGVEKIRRTCTQAQLDSYQYVWIDTCCIDKSSSAELSEAINSMFHWYGQADTCYAYLSDVSKATFAETFPTSRWFLRGWTLQELLAHGNVKFYDRDWQDLGNKGRHADWISDITGIDFGALFPYPGRNRDTDGTFDRYCIARRMSWASNRETTRVEDLAYCLLGIFNISMPLLYGERERAFIRLQEELIKKYDDDSILAWDLDPETRDLSGLISSDVAGFIPPNPILVRSLPGHPRILEIAVISNILRHHRQGHSQSLMLAFKLIYRLSRSLYRSRITTACLWFLCKGASAASEFLGIILQRAEMDGSPDRFVRVTYKASDQRHTQWHTILVGPRTVMQAKRETVTIVQYMNNERWRVHTRGYRHVIVNESQAFEHAGYVTSHGTAKNMTHYNGFTIEYAKWNPLAKSLTLGGDLINEDSLFCFEFTHVSSGDGFTVLVRSRKAIVLHGLSISEAEERSSYEYLGQANRATQDLTLRWQDGSRTPVRVAVTENDLSFTRITEVCVDISPGAWATWSMR